MHGDLSLLETYGHDLRLETSDRFQMEEKGPHADSRTGPS